MATPKYLRDIGAPVGLELTPPGCRDLGAEFGRRHLGWIVEVALAARLIIAPSECEFRMHGEVHYAISWTMIDAMRESAILARITKIPIFDTPANALGDVPHGPLRADGAAPVNLRRRF